MPYIGKEPEHGNYQLLDPLTLPDGVFNGSRTVFNLTTDSVAVYPTSPATIIISLGGVIQAPNTAYTVSGNQITFASAPATSTVFFGVSLGDTLDIGTPSDDSVDSQHYVDGSIDSAHIADDAVTYAKMQNLGTADRVLGSVSTGVIGEVQIVPDMLATNAVTNVKVATGIDAIKLADGTVTNAELQYINSLSSNAQTQITAKAPIASPTFTTGATSPSFITGNSGTIKLVDGDGNHFTTLAAHATTIADVAYTWPDNAPGTSGFALTSTTGGVMSWAAAGGVNISGTPANNQLAIWTDADTLEGDPVLTYTTAGNLFALKGSGNATFEIQSAATAGDYGAMNIQHQTSNSMADGFGVQVHLRIVEGSTVNDIVHIGARRKGADNSGQFYIDTTNAGSSVEAFNIDPAGEVTMPKTPCFAAYNSSADADVTGNNGAATVDFDTEIFDQGNNFANDTFTAPVTGRYLIAASVRIDGVTADSRVSNCEFISSNRQWGSYMQLGADPYVSPAGNRNVAIIDMDINDTLTVVLTNGGESGNVHDIGGGATHPTTYITGKLVA